MSLLLRYRKLGLTTTLRIDAPELEGLAKDLHSSALEDCTPCEPDTAADLAWTWASGGLWQILLKGEPWRSARMSMDLLYLQSDSLLDDFIRERLAGVPMLHAGGVVSPAGNALAICGTSGAGKTSLVLACVLRKWRWLSDELMGFRSDDPLLAEGFRRNFNIKERSFSNFPQTSNLDGSREFALPDGRRRIRFLNPDKLNAGGFVEAAPIRAIIVPIYAPGAAQPIHSPLNGGELIHHLAPELRAVQKEAIAWLAAASRSIPAFGLRYRDPHSAVDLLESLAVAL